MSEQPHLLVEKDGHVVTLTMNRPEQRNALSAQMIARFQDAWEAVDLDRIMALLATDALLTMPPEGMRFEGAPAIAQFFGTVPLDGRLDRIRLVPARANGQPALAAYAQNDTGAHEAYGVMVFAIDGGLIAGITGFPRPDLFERLALPSVLASPAKG